MTNAATGIDRTRMERLARRVVDYYLNSMDEKDVGFLRACLDGGLIPPETVVTMRPILEYLANEGPSSDRVPSQTELAAFETLHADVESLYEERAGTRRALKRTIGSKTWTASEQALAARFGLELLPAGDRTLDLLAHEVALSDFTAKEIAATRRQETARVEEFCGRWYADCNGRDYGEEWNPEEGNQQAGNRPGKLLGIGQGFMATYVVLYLYADRDPDGLVAFLKRRKMAYGKKVARDVLRVYRATGHT